MEKSMDENWCEACDMHHDGPRCLVCGEPTYVKTGCFSSRYQHVHTVNPDHWVVLA